MFCDRTNGWPAVRTAYEAYHQDLQALWRIAIYEARAAGVSASAVREAMRAWHAQARVETLTEIERALAAFDRTAQG